MPKIQHELGTTLTRHPQLRVHCWEQKYLSPLACSPTVLTPLVNGFYQRVQRRAVIPYPPTYYGSRLKQSLLPWGFCQKKSKHRPAKREMVRPPLQKRSSQRGKITRPIQKRDGKLHEFLSWLQLPPSDGKRWPLGSERGAVIASVSGTPLSGITGCGGLPHRPKPRGSRAFIEPIAPAWADRWTLIF